MKIFSVAIGEQYELESERLKRTVSNEIEVFTKLSNNNYTIKYMFLIINFVFP